MADIFISYASEDRERAGRIAGVLESCGWSVWWDRKIVASQAFDEAIERELEAAKCVIVLWSQESIDSEWVKNEAAVASERHLCLLPGIQSGARGACPPSPPPYQDVGAAKQPAT